LSKDWNRLASNLLKAELTKRGASYDDLRQKLELLGINETTNSVSIKINRGTFRFAFFLQCATALGLKNLRLDEIDPS
jgi:hypothetical protein